MAFPGAIIKGNRNIFRDQRTKACERNALDLAIYKGLTALQLTVRCNRLTMALQLLCSPNIDIEKTNARPKSKTTISQKEAAKTPLQIAIEREHGTLAQILLLNGAKTSSPENYQKDPHFLMAALFCACFSKEDILLKRLINNFSEMPNQSHLISGLALWAVFNKKWDIYQILIKNNIVAVFNALKKLENTPSFYEAFAYLSADEQHTYNRHDASSASRAEINFVEFMSLNSDEKRVTQPKTLITQAFTPIEKKAYKAASQNNLTRFNELLPEVDVEKLLSRAVEEGNFTALLLVIWPIIKRKNSPTILITALQERNQALIAFLIVNGVDIYLTAKLIIKGHPELLDRFFTDVCSLPSLLQRIFYNQDKALYQALLNSLPPAMRNDSSGDSKEPHMTVAKLGPAHRKIFENALLRYVADHYLFDAQALFISEDETLEEKIIALTTNSPAHNWSNTLSPLLYQGSFFNINLGIVAPFQKNMLPNDLWMFLLDFLDTKSQSRLMSVSKQFRELINRNSLIGNRRINVERTIADWTRLRDLINDELATKNCCSGEGRCCCLGLFTFLPLAILSAGITEFILVKDDTESDETRMWENLAASGMIVIAAIVALCAYCALCRGSIETQEIRERATRVRVLPERFLTLENNTVLYARALFNQSDKLIDNNDTIAIILDKIDSEIERLNERQAIFESEVYRQIDDAQDSTNNDDVALDIDDDKDNDDDKDLDIDDDDNDDDDKDNDDSPSTRAGYKLLQA